MIPREIPGALRQPKIATIATKKTAGMMRIEEFIVLCVWCVVEAGLNRLCGLGGLPSFILANDLFLADLEPI
jgi:hypothetical protein